MSPQTASKNIRKQLDTLAEEMVARQYALQTRLWQPYGSVGREKSLRDAGYLLTYLAEALDADDPALFCEYVAWVKVLFAGLRFPEYVLLTSLEITRQVLAAQIPIQIYAPAVDILDAGIQSLPFAPSTLPGYIDGQMPVDGLARQYLEALLRRDRHTASEMILGAVKNGESIKDIYLQVFQRSQREIGRLWQINQISIAQEHYCTAATQMIMSQLYPYIFSGIHKDRHLVTACVGGELHEIGARMVADFFEIDGWDTNYLGANTPPEAILRMVDESQANVLALSATMTFHIGKVTEIISIIRKSSTRTKILVGGYPFNLSQGLWRHIGADGYAVDAETAISAAETVLQT